MVRTTQMARKSVGGLPPLGKRSDTVTDQTTSESESSDGEAPVPEQKSEKVLTAAALHKVTKPPKNSGASLKKSSKKVDKKPKLPKKMANELLGKEAGDTRKTTGKAEANVADAMEKDKEESDDQNEEGTVEDENQSEDEAE